MQQLEYFADHFEMLGLAHSFELGESQARITHHRHKIGHN